MTVINPIDNSRITAYNLKTGICGSGAERRQHGSDLKRAYNSIEINVNARLARGVRIFGGTSTERTVANACSAAGTDPNLSLYCDQSKSGIPFETSAKLGVILSVAVVRHHGKLRDRGARGLAPRQRRVAVRRLHRRHRLQPAQRPRNLPAGVAELEL